MSSLFQEKLREIHKGQNKIAPLIEGLEKEIPPQNLDDYYVKLKTIIKQDNEKKSANYETISGTKQEIEVENLFDSSASQNLINKASINKLLILGGAGVGKSTLMQYIAYKWSQGKLWGNKFDFVYRVSLKTLLREGWNIDYILRREDEDLLKCLVHYHFISGLAAHERKSFQLQDMPWLDKKDKMLLLLDGYDEVANLNTENSQRVLKEIFEHRNIILTSRPNAIDQEMSQKFERKIENIGFDDDGINQYLAWYFKDGEIKRKKGAALEEFLDKNASIKEICKIPVNIAMMCFIWSEGDSNKALRQVSNMSDLYQQVVDRLGFRCYAKKKCNIVKSQETLLSEWRGGEKQSDELRVLQHTAYKGMTGGGIKASGDQILTIPGMTTMGETEDVSIQSSINHLKKELKRDMPIINEVYLYGLLKPEGFLVTKETANKEPSETDLQSQNFRFIHLSFQEFLTAQYLVEQLMSNEEDQTDHANFLAQYRNEPRYFLTLKFMAGLLSNVKDNKAERALKIFWDAIMCNPDGVIELGVETKVTLLMHLLSQATREERIDQRIPNRDQAVDLIGSVVLGDLSVWYVQFKESGYTSGTIKEGLIKYFIKNDINWVSNKSFELQKKINSKIKDKVYNSYPNLEEIMEIIRTMINKFSVQQQTDILFKAWDILKDYNEERWRRTKKAIELILTIYRKAKLDIEAKKENEIIDSLFITAADRNLDELSCKAIHEILSNSLNPSSLIEGISKRLKQELENLKRERTYSKVKTVVHILLQNDLGDPQLVKDSLQDLTLFFKDPDEKVSLSALRNAIKFLNKSEKKNAQLINNILNALISLFRSKKPIGDSVSNYIMKTIKIVGINDSQFIRATFVELIPSLRDCQTDQEDSHKFVTRTAIELIKMNCNCDIQSVQEDLHSVLDLLIDFDEKRQKRVSKILIQFIRCCGKSDPQLIRYAFSILMKFVQENEFHATAPVEKVFIGLIKLSGKNQEQLIRETITSLIQLLYNSLQRFRILIFNIIKELVSFGDSNDLQIAKTVFQALIQFLKNETDSSRSIIQEEVLELIKSRRSGELIQDALEIFSPLLYDPKEPARSSISRVVLALIASSGDNKIQLVQDLLKNLTPFLENSQCVVKISVSKVIFDLMKIRGSIDLQLIQTLLKVLTPLLKDINCRDKALFESLIDLLEELGRSDNQLARKIFEVLTPMLKNSELYRRVIDKMIDLMERNDIQLAEDIFKKLTPLFKVIVGLDSYFGRLIEILKIYGSSGNRLARSIFEVLTHRLKNPNDEAFMVHGMISLMEESAKNNNQLVQDIFKTLNQIFKRNRGHFIDFRYITPKAKAIQIMVKSRGDSDTKLVKDCINALIPLLKQHDLYLGKVVHHLIKQLMKKSGKSELQIVQDVLNSITPFLYDKNKEIKVIVTKAIFHLFKISGRKETELPVDMLTELIPILEDLGENQRESVLSVIFEIGDLTGLNDPLCKHVLNTLIPLLENSKETLDSMIKLVHLSPKRDDEFARDLFQTWYPLFDPTSETSKLSSSLGTVIIEVIKLSGKSDTQLTREIFDIMILNLKKIEFFNHWQGKTLTEDIIINIVEFTRHAQFVKETIMTSIQLLHHSNQGLKKTGSRMLERLILEILLGNPNDLIEYFNHSSKEFRDILIFSLLVRLKEYVQGFQLLEQLFQEPKSSLTLENIINQLENKIKFTDQLHRNIQDHLLKLETKNLSNDDYSKYLYGLKIFLESELNQINTLKGPQIIELAMVIIRKEKISEDGSDHSKLIKIAKDVLDIQVDNLNDEGLKWIDDHHENLISLSTETKSFYRKVCHKLLQDQEITALEECLLIKFINQGLTISLTRSGEIIFEGKCYKLRGDNIEQALEKIAKTIIGQQQDILALQYKEHEPIFAKGSQKGMKEAAADKKEVKSIVDSRHKLKNDAWLLTRLRSLKFKSEIVILERRSAFGDHFICHLTGQKEFRFYPNEIPVLTEIFGSSKYGEVYRGELKEVADEVGQKLYESQDKKLIHQIQGEIKENQIYFQQELLKEGSEERHKAIEQELAKKLDNNRVILENELRVLNLSDSQKYLIQEYYEGFVSNFSAVYTSSQAIAVGKVAVDDGTDYYSVINLFIQFKSLDPFGIADILAYGLNEIRSHLATTPVINEANFVKDIAIDSLELSDLVSKTALRIISKPKNRQRIFDAKKEDQPNTIRNKIKNFVLEKLEKLKEKLKDGAQKYAKMKDLFLEEIETTPAFQLGEDDANKIIKQWIELKRSKPSLRMHPKEKKKLFVKAISAASVNTQQPNQQNNKKGDNCALF